MPDQRALRKRHLLCRLVLAHRFGGLILLLRPWLHIFPDRSAGKAYPILFHEVAKTVCAALQCHMSASIQATNRIGRVDLTNALVMVGASAAGASRPAAWCCQ